LFEILLSVAKRDAVRGGGATVPCAKHLNIDFSRLAPSRKHSTGQLGEACRLYNGALQERRDAYRTPKKSFNYYDQANQLKDIRAAGDLSLANFSCCQDILRRVDKTFQSFFLRMKRHQKAGFPRFKPRRRFDSITFPSYGDGIKLAGNALRVQGVGQIEVKLHRPVAGKIKTVTVKRECGKWYVCFSVEWEAQPLPVLDNAIGIDVGLKSFATLSNGETIPNPKMASTR